MGQLYSRKVEEVTLAAGASAQWQINTDGSSDEVYISIDDGADGTPAGYDLLAEFYVEDHDIWKFFSRQGTSAAPETARSWTDPAIPDDMRYTLTNQSGAQATYHVVIQSTR